MPGRKPKDVSTRLGAAIRLKRGGRSQRGAEEDLGLARSALARLERGDNTPSYPTALALARWLGWSVEEVMAAAGEPAEAAG